MKTTIPFWKWRSAAGSQRLPDAASAHAAVNPILPHLLLKVWTVDALPANSPRLEPECTELCDYCLHPDADTGGAGIFPETEKQLKAIWLYDLINYFMAEMKALRWIPAGMRQAAFGRGGGMRRCRPAFRRHYRGAEKAGNVALSAVSRKSGLASSTLANAL